MERISIESEQDKALQVLGETLGTCWFRKNVGICGNGEYSCAGCPTCEKINNCYDYLDDFNKLAAERVAEAHCARLMVNAPKIKEQMFEAKHGKVASNLLWVLIRMAVRDGTYIRGGMVRELVCRVFVSRAASVSAAVYCGGRSSVQGSEREAYCLGN